MDGTQHLIFTPFLVVLLRGEAVRALDLGRAVGPIVGAAAEGRVDARLGSHVVVRACDAAAFQLEGKVVDVDGFRVNRFWRSL